jgi:hypothetical protein
MTDLEENCWSKHLCQSCGTEFRPENELVLTLRGTTNSYCSDLCYHEGLKAALVSAPVFVAPARMDLRVHLLRSMQSR